MARHHGKWQRTWACLFRHCIGGCRHHNDESLKIQAEIFSKKLTRLELDNEKWINIEGPEYYCVIESFFSDYEYLSLILWKDET